MNILRVFAVFSIFALIFAVSANGQSTPKQPDATQKVEVKPAKTPLKTEPKDSPVATPKVQPQAVGAINFEVKEVNLGEVGPNSKHKLNYEFKNTSQGVLNISRVHAPCGCTVPTLKKKEYQPGETGKIDVQFKAPKGAGSVKKHIYIYSNDKDNPKYELTIKCNVVLKVKASPNALKLMLDKENAGAMPIVLESIDGQEFSIKKITSVKNVVNVDFDPNDKGIKLQVTPKFNTENLSKNLNGSIIFELTHPLCSSIIVRYNTPAQYVVSPRAIIQTNADPTEEIKRTIWVTNNYGDDIKIESVKSQKGTVKILKQETVGNRFKIDVLLTNPNKDTKKRYHSDQLQIQIENGPMISVRCQQWFKTKNSAKMEPKA